MAYRLSLDRLKHTAATVAKTQLTRLGQAQDGRTSVLEQRKSLKKLRALLSLATTRSNQKTVRRCDRVLRDAGRKLGMTRDGDALRETLARLSETGLAPAPLVADLRAELDLAERRRSNQSPHQPETAIDLAAIVDGVVAVGLRRTSLKTVVHAATRSYQTARRSRQVALRIATSDAAHDWRKRVQRHARHLQLLSDLWPTEMQMRVASAKEIARQLGEEHDLHLFGLWLAERHVPNAQRDAVAALQIAIDERQRHLRHAAFSLGAHLFAERPRHYHRRLAVYALHQRVIKNTLSVV